MANYETHKSADYALLIASIINILLAFVFGYGFFSAIGIDLLTVRNFLLPIFTGENPLSVELTFKLMGAALFCAYFMTKPPRRNPEIKPLQQILIPLIMGGVVYLGALYLSTRTSPYSPQIYLVCHLGGGSFFIYGLAGGFKLIDARRNSQFDEENKHFPMEKRKIENNESVNIQAKNSWINIVAPRSAVMVSGLPDSGKTYAFLMEGILQQIKKKHTAIIWDWKEGELTKFAYNVFLKHKGQILRDTPNMKFLIFNPAEPLKSIKLNLFHPKRLKTIEDCIDAAINFFVNIDKEAGRKQGEFFKESGKLTIICYLTFLRYSALSGKKDSDGSVTLGNCCTLPHLVALSTLDTKMVFEVISRKEESAPFFSALRDAWENDSTNQLSGQTASGKLPLSLLSTPGIFWATSESDHHLDVNNPLNPAILCLVNDIDRENAFAPVIGTLIAEAMKIVNQPGRLPLHLSLDELYRLFLKDLPKFMATCRSNRISTWLGIQDQEMLTEAYGKELAKVILNTVGTMITGRVRNESAKSFQELFGKTLHDRFSSTMTAEDVTNTSSQQLEYLLPSANLAQFSKGEFAGIIADTLTERLPIKLFRDFPVISDRERKKYHKAELPIYYKLPDGSSMEDIMDANYKRIYREVNELLVQEHNKLYAVAQSV